MNRWCLSIFLVGLSAVLVLGAPKKSFEENVKILRKIDIDTVLGNDRLIRSYIDCVIGIKGCNAQGIAIKESWEEGLDKGCDDCSEDEKRKIKKLAKHIYVNKRPWYNELTAALDKDGSRQERHQHYIDELLADDTL